MHFFLWFVLALLLFPLQSDAQDKGVFLSIVDGDSLMVEIEGRAREIRLIGVDAPEWGQEYGTMAKAFSLKFCYGQTLMIEYDKARRDRFGRTLAYVYKKDKMLNEELVRAGLALAVKYRPNVKHQPRFNEAQEWAKKNRRGFWLHGGLKQTPREWRKRKKK